MSVKQNPRIKKYRRPFPIDPGVFIFVFIAVYILICLILYVTKPHVSVYEVPFGEIANNYTYTGIALRQEQVIPADSAGYINYYAREGVKVGVRSTVYTIDETGKISELLKEATGTALSDEDIKKLKTEVTAFQTAYSDDSFSSVYDFKQNIEGMALELVNSNLLDNLSQTQENIGKFNIYKAKADGVLSYNIDGYESLKPEDVTKETINARESYQKTDLKKQTIINASDPAYKVITEDEWSVVIQTDQETAQKLADENYIEVTFPKDHTTAWGKVSVWDKDGVSFVSFSFTNSMIRFALDRFVDIEFKLDNLKGLKIPESAVIEKSFYTIPVEYLTYGGDDKVQGVYLETYQEDGAAKQEFVKLNIYKKTDSLIYVSTDDFSSGNVIIKPESQDRFTIGKTEKLVGVYNINKGYSVFAPVNIIYQNQDYCIVESDTEYGLAKYDHIVLDASTVKENKAIY